MEDLTAASRELISFARYLFLFRRKFADDVYYKFAFLPLSFLFPLAVHSYTVKTKI